MVIERDKKDEDSGKYEELLKDVANSEGELKLATFVNDSLQGTFPEKFLKFIKDQPKYKLVDVSMFFEGIMRVKLAPEQVFADNSLILGHHKKVWKGAVVLVHEDDHTHREDY